jgi:predicted pyridoxine 5'-phosphate oxidase superfamily flavin-nucleotide-binding protein
MKFTEEMKTCIENSVLCWVATADKSGNPNVSPKEVFTSNLNQILIAHIASPKSARNIQANPQVMVSVVDVLAQYGWQFSGKARLVWAESAEFIELSKPLVEMTKGEYPLKAVMEVSVKKSHRIVAPSSWLFPDLPMERVRKQVLSRYGVQDL